jgi:predicted nucleic-acid-binding protein
MDDAVQTSLAAGLIDEELSVSRPGFVSITALLELDWALRRIYRLSGERIVEALFELMQHANLVFERPKEVRKALSSPFGDLADNILHLTSAENGCTHTLTFDRKFARIDGVELLV